MEKSGRRIFLIWSFAAMFGRTFAPFRRLYRSVTRKTSFSFHYSNIQEKAIQQRLLSSRNDDFQQFCRSGEKTIVTYITDVEGDKAYLDRYVRTSRVLTFKEANDDVPYEECIDFLEPRAMLVFGGDIWDKGGHDLYAIRQLLDLKRRYPDRVVFILGNRDVNKLRILQEIGLQEPPPRHPGLTWFKGSGKVGDPDSNPPPKSSVERLKWMLGNTMGSPDAFEHRKNELKWERLTMQQELSVSDQDVVESYRESCHPRGELGHFLLQAQFACRLGPLMFVHGSLPMLEEDTKEKFEQGLSVWDDLTTFMPWLPTGESARDHDVTTIDEWIVELNRFCSQNVKAWRADIERIEKEGGEDKSMEPMWAREAGYHYGPPGSDLIQYGMGMLPNRMKNPTVVYNTFTPGGMPHRFYPDSEEAHMVQATRDFFDRSGVNIILAGHKPQGDMPSAIKIDDGSWVLLADTSYSSETFWHHDDKDKESENKNDTTFEKRKNLGRGNATSFRGEVAISEVLLELGENGSSLESVVYHGVLSDGTEYETVNLITHRDNTTIGSPAPSEMVPTVTESPHSGRWWTKTIFHDGSHLFYAGEGFHVWNLLSKPKKPNTSTSQ